MGLNRTSSGLLFIAVSAVVGFLLVSFPPTLVSHYKAAAELHPAWGYFYLASVGAGAFILASLSVWGFVRLWRNTRRKRVRRERRGRDPHELSRLEQERELEENLEEGQQLAQFADLSESLRNTIRENVDVLKAKRLSQKLEIVAFGTISSGKSSLLNALAGRDVFRTEVAGGTTLVRNEISWPGSDRVVLADTPGLAEVGGQQRGQLAAEAAHDADVVLFVVDGPLKAYESDLLRALGNMQKRILVCLNKEDWFGDEERSELLAQIANQVSTILEPHDVVAVRAQPAPRRRVRVLPDGSEVQETIESDADISLLATRMLQIVQRDGRELLLGNLLLQSRGLVADAQRRVLGALDRRAEQIISKTMWAAGSAVAVNPIPLLDLAGGSAITVKMVLDLAHVYRQDIDADTVVNLLAQLGKNLIAMLGVTAATPAVVSGLALMLKTVPGIGTIAGGLLQGVVQALVTLWIGKVFIAYFHHEMRTPAGGFVELARKKWRDVTRPEQLRKLIQTGRQEFSRRDQTS